MDKGITRAYDAAAVITEHGKLPLWAPGWPRRSPNAEKWLLDARRVVVEECMEGYLTGSTPTATTWRNPIPWRAIRRRHLVLDLVERHGENLLRPKRNSLMRSTGIYMLEPFFENGKSFI
jgi:hypothetical protein